MYVSNISACCILYQFKLIPAHNKLLLEHFGLLLYTLCRDTGLDDLSDGSHQVFC